LARPRLAMALDRLERDLPVTDQTDSVARVLIGIVAGRLAQAGRTGPDIAARDIVALAKGMIDAAGQAGEADWDALADRVTAAVMGRLAWRPSVEIRGIGDAGPGRDAEIGGPQRIDPGHVNR
jgi:hypothetical protein